MRKFFLRFNSLLIFHDKFLYADLDLSASIKRGREFPGIDPLQEELDGVSALNTIAAHLSIL